jgi:hypothetical protein
MGKSWISMGVLMSSVSIAQTTEDVVYKKDGSILRGSLIEQDFERGQYKIELLGGSVFSIQQGDIHKISKEPLLNNKHKQMSNGGVNVNIENNPKIEQQPNITQVALLEPLITNTPAPIDTQNEVKKPQYKQSLRIAHISKHITDSSDNGFLYNGYSLAYQYNINKYLAAYWEHSRGKLDKVIVDSRQVNADVHGYTRSDEKFYGTQVTTQISSNNYSGLKYYAGIGLFTERYTKMEELSKVYGKVTTLGVGLNKQQVVIHLRISKYQSDQYPNNMSSTVTSLQAGFEF